MPFSMFRPCLLSSIAFQCWLDFIITCIKAAVLGNNVPRYGYCSQNAVYRHGVRRGANHLPNGQAISAHNMPAQSHWKENLSDTCASKCHKLYFYSIQGWHLPMVSFSLNGFPLKPSHRLMSNFTKASCPSYLMYTCWYFFFFTSSSQVFNFMNCLCSL